MTLTYYAKPHIEREGTFVLFHPLRRDAALPTVSLGNDIEVNSNWYS